MKQTPKQKRPKTLNNHTNKCPLIAAFLASNILLGCATAKLSNRTVSSVLEKENVLIRKLKEERSQLQVVDAVQKDETLKLAEAHLFMALDELAKANSKVQSTFPNSSTEGENANAKR